MSPLDTSYLVIKGGGDPIDDDRPCEHCGYNLKGLRTVDLCPECGEPVSFLSSPTLMHPDRPGRVLRDTGRMLDAPRVYLRFVAAAFRLIAIGGLVMFASAVYMFFRPEIAPAALGLLGAVVWTIGAVGVCTPRRLGPVRHPIDTKKEWRIERAATVATQPLWMLSFACVLAMLIIDAPAGPLRVGAVAGALVGAIGVAALCVQLMNLSYWAGDTPLAFRLIRNAWCAGFAVFLSIPLALGSLGLYSLWDYPRQYPLLWIFIAFAGAVCLLILYTLVTLVSVWRLGGLVFGDMVTIDKVALRRQIRCIEDQTIPQTVSFDDDPEPPEGDKTLNPYELADE